MELKVRALDSVQEKSVQEVEQELLDKAEQKQRGKKKEKQVWRRFELRLLDSKSKVLTTILPNPNVQSWANIGFLKSQGYLLSGEHAG